MSVKLNIFTGQLDFTGDGGSTPISTTEYHVQKITLDSTMISNKEVTLSQSPMTANLTRLIVIGGIEQDYGPDFTVSGSTLSWSSLNLDGFLEENDKLVIVYN